MSMAVILGKTSDDNLKVNKSFTSQSTVNLDILGECSEKEPRFIMDLDGFDFGYNYAQIPLFNNSYYYISEKNILDGYRVELVMKRDPLMSFVNPNKSNLEGYVERNENDYNTKIFDEQAIFTNDRDIVTKMITNNGANVPLNNWKLLVTLNSGICQTGSDPQ